ncbi:hypothetical protein [Flavobacterium sp.]|uniref:hypothetical protein n=1 Tax=Flavobacterium sp. TaxID=239 RepID=UPI003751F06C
MKAKISIIIVLLFSLFTNAQENNCDVKENDLSKFISEKKYTEANLLWTEIKSSCVKHSEKIYFLASQILQYNLESSSVDKEKNAKELINLYDQFDKNFPNNENGNFEKRALVLIQNKIKSEVEIYSYLDKAFLIQRKNFTNPQAINEYFKLYFKNYTEQKVKITFSQLLEKYNDVITLVEQNKLQFSNNEQEYNRVTKSAYNLITTKVNCENLTSYVEGNFENKKLDENWLNSSAKWLSTVCKKGPILEKIVLELHKKPTSTSAYYLADYYLNSKNEQQALTFFDQSIALSQNNLEKSKTAYKVASIVAISNKAKAKEMIDIAILNDASNGKNYIFLANLYASSVSECASTENEKKAIYKLASTTVLKASSVMPMLKPTSEKLSEEYLKNVIVDKSIKNKAVKINCWINETVQF